MVEDVCEMEEEALEEAETWFGSSGGVPAAPAAAASRPPMDDPVIAIIEVRWSHGLQFINVREEQGIEAAIRRAADLWYEREQQCRVRVMKPAEPLQTVCAVEFLPRENRRRVFREGSAPPPKGLS